MVLNNHRDQMTNNSDDPPYSRLFVVYNRNDPITESELRHDFSHYGHITDVFIVKDKSTGEQKGVAYVKFTKMSEAAYAMENLNNTAIKNHSGTYKVYIAKSRNESRGPDNDDPDRYLRLFVKTPKTATESDMKLHFSKFGDVQSVKLLRHKDSNESRGIGYVTYNKVSEAARAVEDDGNDCGYKAVIARPKDSSHSATSAEPIPTSSAANRQSNYDAHTSGDYFQASVSSKLSKDQIFRLFDIAPGLRNIQVIPQGSQRSDVIATYNSTLAAEYALNKLHGIEYPLGEFISVESKPFNHRSTANSSSMATAGSKRDYRGEQVDYSDTNREMTQKLSALSKALTDATALLKSAGLSPESLCSDASSGSRWSASSKYCSFQLPPPQKVLPKSNFNETTGMRLFFVGHPSAPPQEALLDVYCRFGNFAGVTILQRKNYGYLYYTSPESALKAIEVTDEKIIAGMSVKILKADPKGEPSHKRKKVD